MKGIRRGRLLLLAAAAVALSVPGLPQPSRIVVNPAQKFQVMAGFGVNFNGTYFREEQKRLIDMLVEDLGATIFRLDPYGLSNWETINDNDDPNVINWEYFNDRYSIPAFEASWAASRYLNSKGVRPFLTLSGIAPSWMLDLPPAEPNRKPPAQADHLRADMHAEFAEMIVSFLLYARHKARVDYEYFSPVNETNLPPREGPGITPAEMPQFLKILAQRMRKEGLADVRLVVADQAGLRDDYIGPILNEAELMKQVGVFSLHTYSSKETIAPHVERVRNSSFAETPVWLTEYGDLNDRDFTAGNEWRNFCLSATERVIRAINDGASAALFWDAYDNFHEHDQRITYYGLVKNTDHIYSPKKRYYAAKQLYGFVRPGSQRIGVSGAAPGIMLTAFQDGKSGSLVVVGLKRGVAGRLGISIPEEAAAPSEWTLYQTTPDWNCARTAVLKPVRETVWLDLPAETIFTLVGPLH